MFVFDSFHEVHFRPTFDAGAVRRCIAIVRAIQADCLATIFPTLYKPVFGVLVEITPLKFHQVLWHQETSPDAAIQHPRDDFRGLVRRKKVNCIVLLL